MEWVIQKIVAKTPHALPHPYSWYIEQSRQREIMQKILDKFSDDEWLDSQKSLAITMMGTSITDYIWLCTILLLQAVSEVARSYNNES